jgi:rhodanese-related sulfurtransferase
MPLDVIGPNTTMAEILEAYPSAKIALFQRYHIGGCQACGYAPTDSLEKVIREHDIADSVEAIAVCIRESASLEADLHVTADDLRAALGRGSTPEILDVRTEAEFGAGSVPGARLLTVALTFDALDSWPKETPIVFVSNRGERSLQRANYFRSYGFAAAKSLMGGLEAWSQGAPRP